MKQLTSYAHEARIFVSASCARCGTPFLLLRKRWQESIDYAFCSRTCKKLAQKQRRQLATSSPCAFCGVMSRLGIVCTECSDILARPCYGKARSQLRVALLLAERYETLNVYCCELCGFWHTGRGNESGEGLRERKERVQQMTALLRSSEAGREWLAQREEAWSPRKVSRKEWRELQ